MIEKELKIREVSGDYALDIPFADGSVNTIYFNSKRNAETVKHIIKLTEVNPTKQPCVICKRLSTESGNLKKIFVVLLGLLAQTAINTSL
jgi:hypothetical protein